MPDFHYTLKRGHIGSDVLRLQRFLIAQGIPLQFGADGDFGAATKTAVEAFQAREGLGADGLFGAFDFDHSPTADNPQRITSRAIGSPTTS